LHLRIGSRVWKLRPPCRPHTMIAAYTAVPESGITSRPADHAPLVVLGLDGLSLTQITTLSAAEARIALSDSAEFMSRLQATPDHLQRHLGANRRIYGVTTGFGERCSNTIDPELAPRVARNLVAFHGAGTGRIFDDVETRAIL